MILTLLHSYEHLHRDLRASYRVQMPHAFVTLANIGLGFRSGDGVIDPLLNHAIWVPCHACLGWNLCLQTGVSGGVAGSVGALKRRVVAQAPARGPPGPIQRGQLNAQRLSSSLETNG
jgi:hypothetical protein